MKVKFFLIPCILSFSVSILGQKIKYPVSEIPDSLMKNAKAVVRDYSVKFYLTGLNRTTKEEIRAITVLDKSGDEHACGYFSYDNERSITSISAKIFDKNGVVSKTFSKKDFKDRSYDPYGSVYNDTRMLSLTSTTSEYPYTIEYIVKYSYKSSYFITPWFPVRYHNQSIQKSSYEITVPKGYNLNVKEINLPEKVKISEDDDCISYTWKLENYLAEDNELFAPSLHDRSPHLFISPSEFQYGAYKGNMNSWKDYGLFFQKLNQGRDELSEETKQIVHDLVSGLESDIDKARVLYNYLQETTRYVSIQVGIGGIQPFPAKVVSDYGYGDCKALTNFMMAILKEVGVKSYYSLIESGPGQYQIESDFVYDPFDHIILNLPLENDTLWLECTSQIKPFGFLGNFTDNRYALVITEEGGVLKRTTKYEKDDNVKITNADVNILSTGDGKAMINTVYTGLEYDEIIYLLNADYETQKDYLYESHIDIPDFNILTFKYDNHKDIDPVAYETLDLEINNFCSKTGTRLFVPLNLMNRFDYVPKKDDERTNPVQIKVEFVHYDTIVYQIPEGFEIEYLPQDDTIHSDFGYLSYQLLENNNQVIYMRKFEIYRNQYPRERYHEFVNFCREIKKADNQKMVLAKKDQS